MKQVTWPPLLALYLRKKLISFEEAVEIYFLAKERLSIVQLDAFTQPVLSLVNNSSCSAYDCEFVAFAQHLETQLVTQDKKIPRVHMVQFMLMIGIIYVGKVH